MSKKLKKFLNDAEKTESKIAELEEYLRNVRAAQKKEEDNEIVRAIRSTKLGTAGKYPGGECDVPDNRE